MRDKRRIEKMSRAGKALAKRIFAGILSAAMIATSFSGDIGNIVRADDPNIVAGYGFVETNIDSPSMPGSYATIGGISFVVRNLYNDRMISSVRYTVTVDNYPITSEYVPDIDPDSSVTVIVPAANIEPYKIRYGETKKAVLTLESVGELRDMRVEDFSVNIGTPSPQTYYISEPDPIYMYVYGDASNPTSGNSELLDIKTVDVNGNPVGVPVNMDFDSTAIVTYDSNTKLLKPVRGGKAVITSTASGAANTTPVKTNVYVASVFVSDSELVYNGDYQYPKVEVKYYDYSGTPVTDATADIVGKSLFPACKDANVDDEVYYAKYTLPLGMKTVPIGIEFKIKPFNLTELSSGSIGSSHLYYNENGWDGYVTFSGRTLICNQDFIVSSSPDTPPGPLGTEYTLILQGIGNYTGTYTVTNKFVNPGAADDESVTNIANSLIIAFNKSIYYAAGAPIRPGSNAPGDEFGGDQYMKLYFSRDDMDHDRYLILREEAGGEVYAYYMNTVYDYSNLPTAADFTAAKKIAKVTYTRNTDVGMAHVKVTGEGGFTGEVNGDFMIYERDISELYPKDSLDNPRIEISGLPDEDKPEIYSGSPKTFPGITLTFVTGGNAVTLRNGVDYNITYSDNVQPGDATISIKGTGNYTGTIKTGFQIVGQLDMANYYFYDSDHQRQIPVSEGYAVTYDGESKTPRMIVSLGGKYLKEDEDYIATYSNNINANEDKEEKAAVTITGLGKYANQPSKTFYFTIKKAPLPSKLDISLVSRIPFNNRPTRQIGSTEYTITERRGTKTYEIPKGEYYIYSGTDECGNVTLGGYDENGIETGLGFLNGVETGNVYAGSGVVAGKVNVVAKARPDGNYYGEAYGSYYIDRISITNSNRGLFRFYTPEGEPIPSEFSYTGNPIDVDMVIYYNGNLLQRGTWDFDGQHTQKGVVRIEVKDKYDFENDYKFDLFKIVSKKLSELKVYAMTWDQYKAIPTTLRYPNINNNYISDWSSVEPYLVTYDSTTSSFISDCELSFDDTPLKPFIVIRDGNRVLVQGTDYVYQSDTGSVDGLYYSKDCMGVKRNRSKLTGIGNYEGDNIFLKYTIVPRKLANNPQITVTGTYKSTTNPLTITDSNFLDDKKKPKPLALGDDTTPGDYYIVPAEGDNITVPGMHTAYIIGSNDHFNGTKGNYTAAYGTLPIQYLVGEDLAEQKIYLNVGGTEYATVKVGNIFYPTTDGVNVAQIPYTGKKPDVIIKRADDNSVIPCTPQSGAQWQLDSHTTSSETCDPNSTGTIIIKRTANSEYYCAQEGITVNYTVKKANLVELAQLHQLFYNVGEKVTHISSDPGNSAVPAKVEFSYTGKKRSIENTLYHGDDNHIGWNTDVTVTAEVTGGSPTQESGIYYVKNVGDKVKYTITGNNAKYEGTIYVEMSVVTSPYENWVIDLKLPNDNGNIVTYTYTYNRTQNKFVSNKGTPATPYTGSKIQGEITVTDPDVGVLTEGTDYDLTEGPNNITCGPGNGSYEITPKAGGNYSGSAITIIFDISTIKDINIDFTSGNTVEYSTDGSGTNITGVPAHNVTRDDGSSVPFGKYTETVTQGTSPVANPNKLLPGSYTLSVVGTDEYDGASDSKPFTVTCDLGNNKNVEVRYGSIGLLDETTVVPLTLNDDGSLNLDDIRVSLKGGPDLVKDTDYTAKLLTPIHLGDGNVIELSGKGNYTGRYNINANIRVNFGACEIRINDADLVRKKLNTDDNEYIYYFTGSQIRPSISLVYNDKTTGTLYKREVDPLYYDKSYPSNVEPGGEKNINVSISQAGIDSECFVSGTIEPAKYRIVYNLDRGVTVEGMQASYLYTKVDEAKTDADVATLKIAGHPINSNCYIVGEVVKTSTTGSVTFSAVETKDAIGSYTYKFNIVTTDLNDSNISVTLNASGLVYNGKPHEPAPVVKDASLIGNQQLIPGTDYTVSYSNNIDAGINTAEVIVKGMGKYSGTVRRSFTIESKPLAKEDSYIDEVTYKGKDKVVTIDDIKSHIYSGGNLLTEGVDYTVTLQTLNMENVLWSGSDIEEYDKAVLITGKGNYSETSKFELGVKVVPAEIKNATIDKTESYFTNTWQTISPRVTANGDELGPNDYSITVTSSIGASDSDIDTRDPKVVKVWKKGTYYITITGKGNYKGTQNVTYRIIGRSLDGYYMQYTIKGRGKTFAKTSSTASPRLIYTYVDEMEETSPIKYLEADGLSYTIGTGNAVTDYSPPAVGNPTGNRPTVVSLIDTKIDDKSNPSQIILEEGVHYQVSYKNLQVGYGHDCDELKTPYMLIEGIGDYEGSVKVFFSMGTSLSEGEASVSVNGLETEFAEYVYDGYTEWKPGEKVPVKVTYRDVNGHINTLVEGEHYDIVWPDDEEFINSGIKRFSIVGKNEGGFYGTLSCEPVIVNGKVESWTPEGAACWYYVNPKKVTENDVRISLGGLLRDDKSYYAYYTGDPIVPTVAVRVKGRNNNWILLEEGVDYKLKFTGNNTEVSDSTGGVKVDIDWLRNYSWQGSPASETYRIEPIKVTTDNIDVEWMEASGLRVDNIVPYYDGIPCVPPYVVRCFMNGVALDRNLDPGTDYTVDYEDEYGRRYENGTNSLFAGFNAGKMYLVVTGKGNYKGEIKKEYLIQASLASIDAKDSNQVSYTVPFYTGEIPVLPDLEVKCGGTTLRLPKTVNTAESTDTKIVWGDYATDNFKVTFTGKNYNQTGVVLIESNLREFSDSKTFEFDTTTSLNDVELKTFKTRYGYTGKPVVLDYSLRLKDGGKVSDIITTDITYFDSTGRQLAAAPTERGEYKATIKVNLLDKTAVVADRNTFWIEARKLTDGISVSYADPVTYNKKFQKPEVMVFDGTKPLEENVDYTVTYGEPSVSGANIKATTYSATQPDSDKTGYIHIHGVEGGNYTGDLYEKFAINLASPVLVTVSDETSSTLRVGWNSNPYVDKWVVRYQEVDPNGGIVSRPPDQEVSNYHTVGNGSNYCTLTNLKCGTEYKITVWGELSTGEKGPEASGTGTTTVSDMTGVSAILGSDQRSVIISWPAVPGADGYEVVNAESLNDNYKLVINLPTSLNITSWTNSGLRSGGTYYYRVRAYIVDADGEVIYGGFSERLPVAIP